jgi:hypothetical protein
MSVVAGSYGTCVIDSVLEHSPAEYVRRPNVPAESPPLGLTHLKFKALLTATKHSTNSCDFALVNMLGLLGLRIFEATGSDIDDLGEEHGHRVLWVRGKETRSSSSRSRPPPAARSSAPSTSGPPADPDHPARHPAWTVTAVTRSGPCPGARVRVGVRAPPGARVGLRLEAASKRANLLGTGSPHGRSRAPWSAPPGDTGVIARTGHPA